MSLAQVIVAVMTKFPEAGKVKTRLTTEVSPHQAAEVHRVFLTHLVRRLENLKPQSLKIVVDPPDKLNAMRGLLETRAQLFGQCDGDLGARLSAAVETIRHTSNGPILFFGVDSPDLPDEAIRRAGDLLEQQEVVVGPSEDGGYWCLGVSSRVDACRLLCDIHWSSGREREQTIARATALGYSVAEADAWDDVDRPADLKRLVARLTASHNPDDRKLIEQLRFLPKEVT